jgi:hypothetical protein
MHPFSETAVVRAYLSAKQTVLRSKFAAEIVRPSHDPQQISESSFLSELAWVVLSSGMAEFVVRAKFPQVSRCFWYWQSAKIIADDPERCVVDALNYFGHEGKIRAIASAAVMVASATSFASVKREILVDPVAILQMFPYIGPITSHHLAKNIGIRTAKPDRHLTRLAAHSGFQSVNELCECIARFLGEDIRMVDSVLWRFATLHQDYLERFSGFAQA